MDALREEDGFQGTTSRSLGTMADFTCGGCRAVIIRYLSYTPGSLLGTTGSQLIVNCVGRYKCANPRATITDGRKTVFAHWKPLRKCEGIERP